MELYATNNPTKIDPCLAGHAVELRHPLGGQWCFLFFHDAASVPWTDQEIPKIPPEPEPKIDGVLRHKGMMKPTTNWKRDKFHLSLRSCSLTRVRVRVGNRAKLRTRQIWSVIAQMTFARSTALYEGEGFYVYDCTLWSLHFVTFT